MAILLKAKEVTKIYAKAQHPSLDKVSFDVVEGEFIGNMGASGSGKTTFLYYDIKPSLQTDEF